MQSNSRLNCQTAPRRRFVYLRYLIELVWATIQKQHLSRQPVDHEAACWRDREAWESAEKAKTDFQVLRSRADDFAKLRACYILIQAIPKLDSMLQRHQDKIRIPLMVCQKCLLCFVAKVREEFLKWGAIEDGRAQPIQMTVFSVKWINLIGILYNEIPFLHKLEIFLMQKNKNPLSKERRTRNGPKISRGNSSSN